MTKLKRFESGSEEVFFQKENAMERGLETVSHFFLTDPDARDILSPRSDPAEKSGKEGDESTSLDGPSSVYIILCPEGLTPRDSFLGRMLALSLAASGVSVGFIETTTRLPHTFFLSGGYENIDAVFWEADLDSPEFLNMIARFRNSCDFVLINTAASVLLKTTGSMGLMGRCFVPATVRPQDLLSAYGTIKNASKKWAMAEIELVVIKQKATDNAAGAAAVLEEMARRFLSCSVRFIGAVTLPDDIDAFGAFSLTPSPQALPDAATAAVKEVARHLIVSGGSRKKRKPHAEKRL